MEFFWYVFSRIQPECSDLHCRYLYSVQMREKTNQKISEYGHFLCNKGIKIVPGFSFAFIIFFEKRSACYFEFR